jgi:hypothetical protein
MSGAYRAQPCEARTILGMDTEPRVATWSAMHYTVAARSIRCIDLHGPYNSPQNSTAVDEATSSEQAWLGDFKGRD